MDTRAEITFAVTFIRDGVLPRATTIFFYLSVSLLPSFPLRSPRSRSLLRGAGKRAEHGDFNALMRFNGKLAAVMAPDGLGWRPRLQFRHA